MRLGNAASIDRTTKSRTRMFRVLLSAALIGVAGWFLWLYGQIHFYATHDDARPADAIAVFGAAEYDGRPSPVLRSRLDHALTLYRERLAPLIITLGGGGAGDDRPDDSEGGVGHDYLVAHGVPEDQIIAETQSTNTEESAERLAGIARENHLNRILAVSDGTHLFRIRALCNSLGLTVSTSPRVEARPLGKWDAFMRLMHEMVSYTLWRLKVH
ncbi:MAG TPA: YdcF family protein [Acidobacteriaceae bacterium]|nr:YdcF family protein [Acidobacteriaceae bacterium]